MDHSTGNITVTAGGTGSITFNVGVGSTVDVGGAGAVSLLKAQDTETFLIAAANAVVGTVDVKAGFTSFAAQLLGLVTAAQTTKARGE
jgi:hypothetical protein